MLVSWSTVARPLVVLGAGWFALAAIGVSLAEAGDSAAKDGRLRPPEVSESSYAAQQTQVEERIAKAFSISPASKPPQRAEQAIRAAASSGRLTLSELPPDVSDEQTSSIGAETERASPALQAGKPASAFDLLLDDGKADDPREVGDSLTALASPDIEPGVFPEMTEIYEVPEDMVPLPEELSAVPTPRPKSEQPVAALNPPATPTADEPETAKAPPPPIETAREERLELPASLLPALPTAD